MIPPPVSRPHAEFEVRAASLRASVERHARIAAKNPQHAARMGIARQVEMSLFANHAHVPNAAAEWLRGAAIALLPRGWRYQIFESAGGGASLAITGYDDPATREAPKRPSGRDR